MLAGLTVNMSSTRYSELSHEEVMHKASVALAAGADFRLLGPRSTISHLLSPEISPTDPVRASGEALIVDASNPQAVGRTAYCGAWFAVRSLADGTGCALAAGERRDPDARGAVRPAGGGTPVCLAVRVRLLDD